jgi:hypothetical protein
MYYLMSWISYPAVCYQGREVINIFIIMSLVAAFVKARVEGIMNKAFCNV